MARVHALQAWGSHLTHLRQNVALSGAQVVAHLAALGIRVDRRTIYAYEAGRIAAPDAGIIWGLAKVYGVDAEELIVMLVQCRTGHRTTSLMPRQEAASHESISVTADERELIREIRSLPAGSRQACRDFVKFETQRTRIRRNKTKQ